MLKSRLAAGALTLALTAAGGPVWAVPEEDGGDGWPAPTPSVRHGQARPSFQSEWSPAPGQPGPAGQDGEMVLGYLPGEDRWLQAREFPAARSLEGFFPLPGLCMVNADFTGKILAGATLGDADFTGAVFRGVDLRRTDLGSATFTGADFKGAILRPGQTLDLVARGVDLRGAEIRPDAPAPAEVLVPGPGPQEPGAGAPVPGQDGETLLGYLPGTVPWLQSRDFAASRSLDGLILMPGTRLAGADFTGKTLAGAALGDADCTRAVFRGVDLRRTDLGSAALIDADFTGALLTPAQALALLSRNVDVRGARVVAEEPPAPVAAPAASAAMATEPDRAEATALAETRPVGLSGAGPGLQSPPERLAAALQMTPPAAAAPAPRRRGRPRKAGPAGMPAPERAKPKVARGKSGTPSRQGQTDVSLEPARPTKPRKSRGPRRAREIPMPVTPVGGGAMETDAEMALEPGLDRVEPESEPASGAGRKRKQGQSAGEQDPGGPSGVKKIRREGPADAGPTAASIPSGPGSREDRWWHLLDELKVFAGQLDARGRPRGPNPHQGYCTPTGARLGKWAKTQRENYHANRARLTQERRAALEAVPGWKWGPGPQSQQAPPAAKARPSTASPQRRSSPAVGLEDAPSVLALLSLRTGPTAPVRAASPAPLEGLAAAAAGTKPDREPDGEPPLQGPARAGASASARVPRMDAMAHPVAAAAPAAAGSAQVPIQARRSPKRSLPVPPPDPGLDSPHGSPLAAPAGPEPAVPAPATPAVAPAPGAGPGPARPQAQGRTSLWEPMVRMLRSYADRYGQADPPPEFETSDGIKLGRWAERQRARFLAKDPTLTPEAIQALKELPGWRWERESNA